MFNHYNVVLTATGVWNHLISNVMDLSDADTDTVTDSDINKKKIGKPTRLGIFTANSLPINYKTIWTSVSIGLFNCQL